MTELFPDTHPEAEAVLIRLLHLMGRLGQTVRALAFSRLRQLKE